MKPRYYPKFYIVENLNSQVGQLAKESGEMYLGKYYTTLNGRFFSGPNPQVGPNEELFIMKSPQEKILGLPKNTMPEKAPLSYETEESLYLKNKTISEKPTFYYPTPTENDYRKGYIIRYFTKKENEYGNIIEITQNEYNNIVNGTATYNISIYQTDKILWKLTGPLNSQRKSQYNIIPGIIETNKRLTEEANKTLFGMIEFIGGEYSKFARPTPQ